MTIRFAGALLAAAMTTATAAHADDLVVAHYCALMPGAPFTIALEKGYFAEAGLKVDGIISGKGGGDTVRTTMANAIPYGEAGLGAVLAAREKGVPLVVVNSGTSSISDMDWFVKPDSDIRNIEDLKGRRLGITNPKGGSDQLTRQVLQKAGIAVEDVKLVTTGGLREGLTMLGEGQVDAMPAMEPIATQIKGKFRKVFGFNDYVPSMTQLIGFTTEDFARSNPDTVRAIVEGRRKAVRFIYEKPDEAAAILEKRCEMKPGLAQSIVGDFVKVRYWSEGDFDREGLDTNVAGLRLIGAWGDTPVDWNAVIDQSFLPEDLRKAL